MMTHKEYIEQTANSTFTTLARKAMFRHMHEKVA